MEPLSLSDFIADLPRPGVLCTLAAVVGSAPQSPGAKMWVWSAGFEGTLGGGRFEAAVLADARRFLVDGVHEPRLKEYTLCREMGQCCGGKVQVFFEPAARRRVVHIFGAGHVGRALAGVLDGLDLETIVCDSRREWAKADAFPAATRVVCAEPLPLALAAGYAETDAVCVMTHDHEVDFRLIDALLDKPVGFLGLNGSEHKARVFRARLGERRRMLWDERVRCPIGRRIPSKRPKAIAVATAAELLEKWAYLRRRGPAVAAEAVPL